MSVSRRLIWLFAYLSLVPYYTLHLAHGLTVLRLPGVPAGLPVLKYLPFCWIVIWAAWWGATRERRAALWRVPLRTPLIVWVLANAVGSLFAEAKLLSLGRTVYYAITGPLLYALIVAARPGSAEVVSMMRRMAAIGAVTVGAALLLFLLPYEMERKICSALYGDELVLRFIMAGRLITWGGNPWVLGSHVVLLLPICLAQAAQVGRGRGWWRLGTWVVFMGLWLTFSGGAYLGAFAVLGVVCCLSRRTAGPGGKTAMVAMMGILLCTSAVVVVGWIIGPERLHWIGGGAIHHELFAAWVHVWGRVETLTRAWSLFIQSPLVGIGWIQSWRFESRYPNVWIDLSGYLTPFLAAGVVGGVCWLTVVGRLWVVLRRGLRQVSLLKGGDDPLPALAASVLGFCVDLLYWNSPGFPTARMSFWIIAGLAVACAMPPPPRSLQDE